MPLILESSNLNPAVVHSLLPDLLGDGEAVAGKPHVVVRSAPRHLPPRRGRIEAVRCIRSSLRPCSDGAAAPSRRCSGGRLHLRRCSPCGGSDGGGRFTGGGGRCWRLRDLHMTNVIATSAAAAAAAVIAVGCRGEAAGVRGHSHEGEELSHHVLLVLPPRQPGLTAHLQYMHTTS
jgi:hypothetical protein